MFFFSFGITQNSTVLRVTVKCMELFGTSNDVNSRKTYSVAQMTYRGGLNYLLTTPRGRLFLMWFD